MPPNTPKLLESIGDPVLTVALSFAAIAAKFQASDIAEVSRLAQRVIDLADGDPTKGNLVLGSPLASALTFRGAARCALGNPGWKGDFREGIAIARAVDATTLSGVIFYTYLVSSTSGALCSDETALRDTAETLEMARSGANMALNLARTARGIALVYRLVYREDGPERAAGLALPAEIRDDILRERFSHPVLRFIDIYLAREKARSGDLDAAIELNRAYVDDELAKRGVDYVWPAVSYLGPAVTTLVESLLRRGTDADLNEAQTAIVRAASVFTDSDYVLLEPLLLRLQVLLARAHGDETAYRDYRDRYRALATSLGFEGHMRWAEAMP